MGSRISPVRGFKRFICNPKSKKSAEFPRRLAVRLQCDYFAAETAGFAASDFCAATAFLCFMPVCFFTLGFLGVDAESAGTVAAAGAAFGATFAPAAACANELAATLESNAAINRDLILTMIETHSKNDSRSSSDHLERAQIFFRLVHTTRDLN